MKGRADISRDSYNAGVRLSNKNRSLITKRTRAGKLENLKVFRDIGRDQNPARSA
jgi:hypothetical protein